MKNLTEGQYPVKDDFYRLIDSIDMDDLREYIKWLFDSGYTPTMVSYKKWKSYF
jgi:hypothetical protein